MSLRAGASQPHRLVFRVRQFHATDERAVIELLNRAHGPGDGWDRTVEFFRWKHFHNPFGRSTLYVADRGGEIIGVRAIMRWRLTGSPRGINATRTVDAATAMDARHEGVFTQVTRMTLAHVKTRGYAATWSTPNEASFRAIAKIDPCYLGRIPLFVLPLNPLAMLWAMARRGEARRRPWVVDSSLLIPADEGLRNTPTLVAAIRGDAATMRGAIATERSPEWLRWRYASAPSPQYFVASSRRSVGTLMIVRLSYRRRLREMMVVELLIGSDAQAAKRLLRQVARSVRADYVIAGGRSGPFHDRLLREAGFLPAPRRFGLRLVAFPLAWPADAPDPTNPHNWYLSLGDVELL